MQQIGLVRNAELIMRVAKVEIGLEMEQMAMSQIHKVVLSEGGVEAVVVEGREKNSRMQLETFPVNHLTVSSEYSEYLC